MNNLPRWLDIHSSQDHEIRHPAIIFFESVNETNGVCNNLKKEPFQQTSGNNTNQLEKSNVARKKQQQQSSVNVALLIFIKKDRYYIKSLCLTVHSSLSNFHSKHTTIINHIPNASSHQWATERCYTVELTFFITVR